jgi:hypothetical protein
MLILPSNLYGDRGTLIDTIRHLPKLEIELEALSFTVGLA